MGPILGKTQLYVEADDDGARKKTDEADREDELEPAQSTTVAEGSSAVCSPWGSLAVCALAPRRT